MSFFARDTSPQIKFLRQIVFRTPTIRERPLDIVWHRNGSLASVYFQQFNRFARFFVTGQNGLITNYTFKPSVLSGASVVRLEAWCCFIVAAKVLLAVIMGLSSLRWVVAISNSQVGLGWDYGVII